MNKENRPFCYDRVQVAMEQLLRFRYDDLRTENLGHCIRQTAETTTKHGQTAVVPIFFSFDSFSYRFFFLGQVKETGFVKCEYTDMCTTI